MLLAAFFWGTTFVAQDLASDAVGPFTFNGMRMVLGALLLIPVILIRGTGKLFAENVYVSFVHIAPPYQNL